MRIRRLIIPIAVGIVSLSAWYLYSHSTYAETSPLRELREHLSPDRASISWDLVDGYWMLEFHGSQATDLTVAEAMPFLTALPTHTPIDALDYDRSFSIRLTDTEITDSGLHSLAALPIAKLFVTNSPITDRLVDILAKENRLFMLHLNGTDVSEKGLDAIKELHPSCDVQFTAGSRTKR